jgi:hypothetical protein
MRKLANELPEDVADVNLGQQPKQRGNALHFTFDAKLMPEPPAAEPTGEGEEEEYEEDRRRRH